MGPKIFVSGIKQNIRHLWIVQVEMLKSKWPGPFIRDTKTTNDLRVATVLKVFN